MSDGHFVERGTLDLWDDTMRDQRNRIKELEAERDELRSAIFGSEDYASDLRNGNFCEMAELLHAAQKGGLARAEIAEANLAKIANALADLADCVDLGCYCSEMQMATAVDNARSTLTEINGGGDT